MSHDSARFRLDPYNDLGMNNTDARLLKDQDKLQILANWFDMQDAARSYDGSTDLQDDLRRIAARLSQLDEAVRLLRRVRADLLAEFPDEVGQPGGDRIDMLFIDLTEWLLAAALIKEERCPLIFDDGMRCVLRANHAGGTGHRRPGAAALIKEEE